MTELEELDSFIDNIGSHNKANYKEAEQEEVNVLIDFSWMYYKNSYSMKSIIHTNHMGVSTSIGALKGCFDEVVRMQSMLKRASSSNSVIVTLS